MNEKKKSQSARSAHWLQSYNLSIHVAAWCAVAWVIIGVYIAATPAATYINLKIEDPINFKVRGFLGKAVKLDQRIKVFAFDDKAFSEYRAGTLSIDTWAEILAAVAEKHPKIMFIDSMFSENSRSISDFAQTRLQAVRASRIPVATGAFVVDHDIHKRHILNSSAVQFSSENYMSESLQHINAADEMPKWKNRAGWIPYGPSEAFESLFDKVGHFQLFKENRIEPFLWLGEKKVIPHVAMYGADSVRYTDHGLLVNGHHVGLNSEGETPVNFVNPGEFDVYSMSGLIDSARRSRLLEKINQGDVVIFLPLYFTGNADLRPSPYGLIPGGVYLVSIINSVLSGNWLQPVMAQEVLTIVFILIFSIAAYYLSSTQYLIFWTLTTASALMGASVLFSSWSVVVPYVLPLLCASMSGVTIFLMGRQKEEFKAVAIHAALDGAISPGQMAEVLLNPNAVKLETRERIVSLVFIDIVGFSASTETMIPRVAFECLKNLLGTISGVVHAHGGVVDKTLGDGLLCYFGYRFDSDSTLLNHAEKAVRCGIAIQELLLVENIIAARAGGPIYPLRVGINTASCYLGDLGSGSRVEFTVVGNGVNFAKRLESACQTNCVMIGETTADLVKGVAFGDCVLAPKMIYIKHRAAPLTAFEIDPFINRKAEIDEIEVALQLNAQYRRSNGRVVIADFGSIIVSTSVGDAKLLNFSSSGASLLFEKVKAEGMTFTIDFESRIPGMQEVLRLANIENIDVYVCWSYVSGTSYAHGIKFTSLSTMQQLQLAKILSDYAFLHTNLNSLGAA